jgi:hypothetical protein
MIGLMAGGAALGFAEGKGWLNKVPAIGGSRALPIAAVGFAATKVSRNPTVRLAGACMAVVGAFDWARSQGGTHGIFGVDGGAGAGGGF